MKSFISFILAVGIGAAGFAESRQADKALQEDFTRRLADVEMCLEIKDGEQCLRIYHEMWKKGYRLTEGDKRNVEVAFDICKKNYKTKLKRAIVNPHFKEEDVRKWWNEIWSIYNELTGKR